MVRVRFPVDFPHPHRLSVGPIAGEAQQGPAGPRKPMARQNPRHALDPNPADQRLRVHPSRMDDRMRVTFAQGTIYFR